MKAVNRSYERYVHNSVASAVIAVAQVRYVAFCERFGREPEPDEPLLFDPDMDHPTAANLSDRRLQVVSAAMLSNVDPDLALNYFGFTYTH